jgi:hypothetical protein
MSLRERTRRAVRSRWFRFEPRKIGIARLWGRSASNENLLIIVTATVLLVGALAVMNNACKSGPHA